MKKLLISFIFISTLTGWAANAQIQKPGSLNWEYPDRSFGRFDRDTISKYKIKSVRETSMLYFDEYEKYLIEYQLLWQYDESGKLIHEVADIHDEMHTIDSTWYEYKKGLLLKKIEVNWFMDEGKPFGPPDTSVYIYEYKGKKEVIERLEGETKPSKSATYNSKGLMSSYIEPYRAVDHRYWYNYAGQIQKYHVYKKKNVDGKELKDSTVTKFNYLYRKPTTFTTTEGGEVKEYFEYRFKHGKYTGYTLSEYSSKGVMKITNGIFSFENGLLSKFERISNEQTEYKSEMFYQENGLPRETKVYWWSSTEPSFILTWEYTFY